jgi:adenine phosphoribosyltransferase
VDRFVWLFLDHDVDKVIGTESRGFILAPIVAYNLRAGFVPVRKPGKLPAKTWSETYDLEYGTDELHMHEDAVAEGERVLIVDDLMATGGTAAASAALAEQSGGRVVGLGFLIELTFLDGRKRLDGYEVHSLIKY